MRKRTGVAGLAALLCVGLPASGLLGGAPEAWRVLCVLAGLLVLPSTLLLAPARAWARGSAQATPLVAGAAFFLWLSALAVWTECFTRAGASFRTYADATTWSLLVLFSTCAGVGLATRRAVPAGTPLGGRRALRWLLFAAACAAFAAWVRPALTAGEDSLDHIGYVRRIVTFDALRPDGVLAWPRDATAVLPADPRKGALHPVLALVCRLADADPSAVWRWLPVVMFPAGVFAFLAFSAAFVTSTSARAVCAVLFFASYHGNAFHFVTASVYGQSLAADWAWMLVPAGIVLAKRSLRARDAAGWSLLVAGGVLVHSGVFLHATVFAATLVLFGGWWEVGRAARLRVAAATIAPAVLALVVRIAGDAGSANEIHRHGQGVLYVGGPWFVASPMEILRQHGMLFLGGLALLPVLVLAARTRRDARAIAAASALPVGMAFIPPLATWLFARGSYMAFRPLLNAPVFPALVVAIAWLVAAARARGIAARLAGAAVLAAWVLTFVRPVPGALRADTHRQREPLPAPLVSDALARSVDALPGDRTILSDPATSYVLSARGTNRFVALYQQHANPYDPYALDRLCAVRDVLSPYAPVDLAAAACRRYGVDYVLVNSGREPGASDFLAVWSPVEYEAALRRLDSMRGSFTRVGASGGGCLYRFDAGAPVEHSWTVDESPVALASPLLAPCAVDAPGDAFRVTGVSVVPDRALPGDSVVVTLGYRHDAPTPFDLPVWIHLRFDHETLAGARRYPGEKPVRRAADRRRGTLSRFRADVRPGHGLLEPDMWPAGPDLCESFTARIPPNARLGRYRVEVAIVRDALFPNFHLSDLLYNRDHYSGRACAELVVTDRMRGEAGRP